MKELDDELLRLEKELHTTSKQSNNLQKDYSKLKNENLHLKDQLNKLHEGEPTVLAIQLENYDKLSSGQPDNEDIPAIKTCLVDKDPKELTPDILNELSDEKRNAICEFLMDKVQPYLLV